MAIGGISHTGVFIDELSNIGEAIMLIEAHEARIKKEIEENIWSSHRGALTPHGRKKLLLCA